MKFRTFIVEDSATIRQNLTETLQEMALVEPVGSAETEHDAKRWLARNPDAWDLVIVDLFLREGSGLNVLEALARCKRGQRIIVLSNHATRDVRWRCAQLGADAVFDKSTEIDELIEFCMKHLGRELEAH
ncbi:response regulator [Ramlibacter sp.]|uniref:response regulator n=1 Tax=Ramlibacter sp. TaxID=1917967 RepID=UPI0018300BC3|nr:response regulator [Ramlibacter sp.]MBA2674178.1 response regulator [Ramlibacter sp.]